MADLTPIPLDPFYQRLLPASVRDQSGRIWLEMAERIGSLDLTKLLVYIIDLVDASALPELMAQYHVAGYEGALFIQNDATDPDHPDQWGRRELVKQSIWLHQRKGTPWLLRHILERAGFGTVIIIERPGELCYDGTYNHDGLCNFGNWPGEWTHYHIITPGPVPAEQGALIRGICREFSPARSLLRDVLYSQFEVDGHYIFTEQYFDETINYNGDHTYGSA